MANRKAKRGHRPATRNQPASEQRGSRCVRYALAAVGCVTVAVGSVWVVILTTDVPPEEPGDAAVSGQPPVQRSLIDLPTTPQQTTVDDLKREALREVEGLLVRFPQSAEAHHIMAMLQNSFRQTQDAREYWRKCLALAPNHARARVGLARVLIDLGDDETAVQTLREAGAIGCSSDEILSTLASTLMQLGRQEEAMDVLEKGLAVFPQSPQLWMLLGQTRMQAGDFSQAESSLRTSIKLSPEYTDAHYSLATACLRLGKREEAAEFRRRFAELKAQDRQLEDRLALAPDLDMVRQKTAGALCGAGTVCLQRGDRAEAERLLLRSVAVAPGIPESYKALASLYQSDGRTANARVVQGRLVETEPKNVVNYVNLANLSMRLGDTQAAEEALRRAIEVRPDAAIGYSTLARIYRQTGRFEEASLLDKEAARLTAGQRHGAELVPSQL